MCASRKPHILHRFLFSPACMMLMLLPPRYVHPLRTAALLFTSLMFAAGCGSTAPTAEATGEAAGAPGTVEVSYTVISDSIPQDASMEELVAPYRADMQAEVERVIAYAPEELSEGRPEGPLGNVAADAMLYHARRLADGPVHMALTNNGGLRVPLGPGDITVSKVYELMPFENRMVVLTLSGTEVVTLAEQLIARYGGEPIAGFSFAFDPETGAVANIRVNDAPLDRSADYRLVTSDYLADGGGAPVLEGKPREELPMLLREAFIAYFESMGTLTAEIEGRITPME
jgi:2',3'-cyclic-nucleotide 2'-phosphodiesterase (5'-nucleotidase family)